MSEKIYEIEIVGTTPLLQHKFNGDLPEPKAKKKAETSKENKVEDTLYMLPDGKIYQPADCIKQALIEAGKAFKVGRKNLSQTAASFLRVQPEAIIHANQKWITDRRAVVIPSTRGRVMRNRGRLDEWALRFKIQTMDENELNADKIESLLEHAGKYVGIGDYRPQKKGMYGTFRIQTFKEAK